MQKPSDSEITFVVFGRIRDAQLRVIESMQRRVNAATEAEAMELARHSPTFAGHEIFFARSAAAADKQAWLHV